ncbi:RNA polymerase sigma factor [Sutcliffiella cohnii]
MIEKAKAGNEQAFTFLIETYKNYVYQVIYPVLRNEKDAEDALQEVWMKLFDALPQYTGQGFKTWLARIAMNHAIDMRRKKQRLREVVEEQLETEKVEDTEKLLLKKESKEVVHRRLQEMPENYRDVITAYYIREKSYKEIAHEQNIEVKTVETKLYRARVWMKKHWREEDFS